MDHIRQAVSKARDQRQQYSPGRGPGYGRSSMIDWDNIADAECDLDAFSRNRIIANEHDPVLNAYRVLRTRVLQRMEEEGWRTLAVVSPSPAAGKTVTAINLATAISSSKNSTAALADFDFYRPSVSRYMNMANPGSLLDYFEGEKELEEVTRRTGDSNLIVMANERVSRRGAEFFSSARLPAFIDKTLDGFRTRALILDTSPILGCDDTLALLPHIDCVLLVAASGQTRAGDLKEAKRLLKDTNVVGTILNMAPNMAASSGYYYY